MFLKCGGPCSAEHVRTFLNPILWQTVAEQYTSRNTRLTNNFGIKYFSHFRILILAPLTLIEYTYNMAVCYDNCVNDVTAAHEEKSVSVRNFDVKNKQLATYVRHSDLTAVSLNWVIWA